MNHCAPVLVTSMLGPLMSRIQCYLLLARKNRKLAEQLTPVFKQIGEQLLPYYCSMVAVNHSQVNKIHHLVFILASKLKESFYSSVIRTCLDQNWSLKGLKQTLHYLLKSLNVKEYKPIIQTIDNQIKNQNLQSSSCAKIFASYVRHAEKHFDREDFKNILDCYETDFETVTNELIVFRKSGLPDVCFTALNAWQYDFKNFDLKLTMNNNITDLVYGALGSVISQVFWLSYFKCQSGVSSDDFFTAIQEICQFQHMEDYFKDKLDEYQQIAKQLDFFISIRNDDDSKLVQTVVDDLTKQKSGYDFFRKIGKFATPKLSQLVIILEQESSLQTSVYQDKLNSFNDLKHIKVAKNCRKGLVNIPQTKLVKDWNPQNEFHSDISLYVEFFSADLEQNKGIFTVYNGQLPYYRIGEGDSNEFQVPNDKKLWETQLQFSTKQDKYFVRDCGRVHPTRIQLSNQFQVQLQKQTVIDFGNCLQYVVEQITHVCEPFLKSSQSSDFVLQINQDYKLTGNGDPPTLKLKPYWISPNINQDKVPNELIFEASPDKACFSIGRSLRNDTCLDFKELSSDHCQISYSESEGWLITEKNNSRSSSNGTFVFLKSQRQILEQSLSDLVLLQEGMVLSFVTYQLQVSMRPTIRPTPTSKTLGQLRNYDPMNSQVLTGSIATSQAWQLHKLTHESEQSFSQYANETQVSIKGEINLAYSSEQDIIYATQTMPKKITHLNNHINNTQFAAQTLELPSLPVTKQSNNVLIMIETSEVKIIPETKDQLIQATSQNQFKDIQTQSFAVQTSQILEIKAQDFKEFQELAIQTDSKQEVQNDYAVQTDENKVQTTDFNNQTEEVVQKSLHELAIQTDSLKSLQKAELKSAKQLQIEIEKTPSEAILHQNQVNIDNAQFMSAISLPEVENQQIIMQQHPSVKSGGTNNSFANLRYQENNSQQQTIQKQVVFGLRSEDNKLPVDSSSEIE